jgi:hypothetical protein
MTKPMQATFDPRKAPSRPRPDAGAIMVVAGIAIALVAMTGDLVAHTLDPAAHAHEELIVLGAGNNPWHLALFAGILVAAVGGIRWVVRLGSDVGALLGTGMIFLLAITLAAGTWSGWKAAHEPPHQLAAAGGATTAGHVHTGAGGAAATGEGNEGQSLFGGHSHGAPGPTTPAQAAEVQRELSAMKAATAKYRDIAVARADGFRQVTQFIPGLGLHMAKISALGKGFDYLHPDILLYEPTASGGLKLVGAAYSVPHVGDAPPEGFPGGGDVWHYHQNLCFVGGAVTIAPSAAACETRGGVFQAKTAWLLHAWVWTPNPEGVFTEYNANVF